MCQAILTLRHFSFDYVISQIIVFFVVVLESTVELRNCLHHSRFVVIAIDVFCGDYPYA